MNNSQKLRKKYPMMNMRMGEKQITKTKWYGIIDELRSKNPYIRKDNVMGWFGYVACVIELERLLKEKK